MVREAWWCSPQRPSPSAPATLGLCSVCPAVPSVVAPGRPSGNRLLAWWPFPQKFSPSTLLLWQTTSTDQRCWGSSGGLFATGGLRVPVVAMPSLRGANRSLVCVCVVGTGKRCASPSSWSHFLYGSLSLTSTV